MIHKASQHLGDDTPVTGGVPLPSNMVAPLPDDDAAAPSDDLGRQAYWLLRLHANVVSHRYNISDLNKMDDDAKRLLIADIQQAIGVTPLKSGQV
jgi:hypothetical protein